LEIARKQRMCRRDASLGQFVGIRPRDAKFGAPQITSPHALNAGWKIAVMAASAGNKKIHALPGEMVVGWHHGC
jgi:hypothetical protein